MTLAGKKALITGGSRSIGRGIALKLAQEGAPRRSPRAGMRPLLRRALMALLLCVTFSAGRAAAQDTSDERAVQALIEAHSIAWNKRDAKAASAIYADNATIVLSSGREYIGRVGVEQWHTEALSGANPSSHTHPPETTRIRFLRPDFAVADLESRSPGVVGPDGKEGPLRRGQLFIVLTKTGGEWRVAAQRPSGVPLK